MEEKLGDKYTKLSISSNSVFATLRQMSSELHKQARG